MKLNPKIWHAISFLMNENFRAVVIVDLWLLQDKRASTACILMQVIKQINMNNRRITGLLAKTLADIL